MMDQPIKKSMNKPNTTGRMVQWAIELSQFNIKYPPKTAIKAQAPVNFIAEFTLPNEDKLINETEPWTIQIEGWLAQKRRGVTVVVTAPDGEVLKYGVQLKFLTTNNEVEYEGILTGLKIEKALGAKNLLI